MAAEWSKSSDAIEALIAGGREGILSKHGQGDIADALDYYRDKWTGTRLSIDTIAPLYSIISNVFQKLAISPLKKVAKSCKWCILESWRTVCDA